MVNWDRYSNDVRGALSAGEYRVRVKGIVKSVSKKMNEVWNIEMEVVEGPAAGRSVKDRFVWDIKKKGCMDRIKYICGKMGLKLEGEKELREEELIGREVMLTVEVNRWNDMMVNKIRYDGYREVGNEAKDKRGQE